MLQNKIVAHFQDGRLLKGTTRDFVPNKELFHLEPVDAPPGTKPVEVLTSDLKAVFFVKDFTGHSEHKDRQGFDPAQRPMGRKIRAFATRSEHDPPAVGRPERNVVGA